MSLVNKHVFFGHPFFFHHPNTKRSRVFGVCPSPSVFLYAGERPYKCKLDGCTRAFAQLSNLQQHMRNHDNQMAKAANKPFQCNICTKMFATESGLKTHSQKVCIISRCVLLSLPSDGVDRDSGGESGHLLKMSLMTSGSF